MPSVVSSRAFPSRATATVLDNRCVLFKWYRFPVIQIIDIRRLWCKDKIIKMLFIVKTDVQSFIPCLALT